MGEAVLAPGKVNLCLLVGAPRADGLHPLVSVVQPTRLADEVTLEWADEGGGGDARAGDRGGLARGGDVRAGDRGGEARGGEARAGDRGGLARGGEARGGGAARGRAGDLVVCPGVDGDNLAARALREFRDATGWDGPPLRLTIAKRIPIAAGMAGGSSDAAAALRLAARASGLPIPPGLAMRLGADVPVMLEATRALMTGAGEHVEPLSGDAPPLIVVPLDAELGAAEVYRAFDAIATSRSPQELEDAAARIRAGEPFEFINDLEPAARQLCPEIDQALDALRAAGVEHPMVTGSGPTVFGISDDPEAVVRLQAAGYPRATAA